MYFEGRNIPGLLFCKRVSSRIELLAWQGRYVYQVDSVQVKDLVGSFFSFGFFFFFFRNCPLRKETFLAMFIPGIFCPLSLTLLHRSPLILASVTHSNGHSSFKKKNLFVKLEIVRCE